MHIEPEALEHVRAWYERKGKYGLVISYFIPGIRHLAAYVTGSSRLSLPVFATFAYLGGLLWSGSFISIGCSSSCWAVLGDSGLGALAGDVDHRPQRAVSRQDPAGPG